MKLAAQRHGVHAEIALYEVVVRRPLHRPFRGDAEARGCLDVPRGRAAEYLPATRGRRERVVDSGGGGVPLHALLEREGIDVLKESALLFRIDEDRSFNGARPLRAVREVDLPPAAAAQP